MELATKSASRIPPIFHTIGVAAFAAILWWIDTLILRKLPAVSPWRYVISATIAAIGLTVVCWIALRIAAKETQ
ncbi:MAG: hypothetical protein WA715_02815 [Candidatus Acidiferrum sp.]